ncbi:MAG: hypothetical protein ACFFCS_25450, partial [Candidatus Hodarchaeota archaeon]
RQEEIIKPRKKKTIIDIINHKILSIIIVCSIIFVIFYIIHEKIQISFTLVLILIDLYAAMIISYYTSYFLKYDFYPKFLECVNLPVKRKKEFNNNLYGKKSILIIVVTFPFVLSLGFVVYTFVAFNFLTNIIVYLIFFVIVIIVLLFFYDGLVLGVCGVIQAFRFSKYLEFDYKDEDNMGGSKKVLELYFKNIYPFFLLLIIMLAIAFQATMGSSTIWGFQVQSREFQLLFIFAVLMGIGIFCLALFYFHFITYRMMKRFKKKRRRDIKIESIKLLNRLQGDEILDNGAKNKIVIQVLSLNLEKECISDMKSVLINSSVIKKLVISFVGILISYLFNVFLRFFTI